MSSPSTSGSEPGAGFRLLRLETAAGGAPLRPPAAAGEPPLQPLAAAGESPLQPPAAAGADPSGGGHAAPGGSAAAALAVAEILIPSGSPIFAGHFPGRPLLPGIAHLALLRQVLDALAGRGEVGEIGGGGLGTPTATAITEVHRLRLRQPVSPGDRLELRVLAIDAAGTVRFEVRRQSAAGGPGGEIAADGAVRCGTGGLPSAAALAQQLTGAALAATALVQHLPGTLAAAALAKQLPGTLAAASDFPDPAELLPHAPPARLLTAVLEAGAAGITATGAIPADHPLAAGGEAPGFLALELAAQAAGAGEALARSASQGPPRSASQGLPRNASEDLPRLVSVAPRIGYLVGVRGARLPAALPIGRALRVTAAPAGSAGALATYEVEIADAASNQPLATGTISTFLPDS